MSFKYTNFYARKESVTQKNQFGYPAPGPQKPTPEQVAQTYYFVSADQWPQLLEQRFDAIVIGTGPTGVAFIEQAYKNNPYCKILVLERGELFLPVHYQMLPTAFKATSGSPPTTYPWSRTTKMAESGSKFFQAGYIPMVGGRSTYWSAWCPTPTPELMRDWPQELIDVTQKDGFWQRARKFLHVTETDKIQNGVYANLQDQIVSRSGNVTNGVPSVRAAQAAPIAVDIPEWKTVKFYKYASVGPLLNILETQAQRKSAGTGEALTIADQCIVQQLVHDGNGNVTSILTSRGVIKVGEAQVVLAMGTIPPATLLMNSFRQSLPLAGKRYTGHFMSHVTARVKRSAFDDLSDLEIGALYVDGLDKQGLQYHCQVSAFAQADPAGDAVTVAREDPDAAATASMEQLQGSEDYVVFVCATLGEVSEDNNDNWMKLDQGSDPTSNLEIQLVLGDKDRALWNTLDVATYEILTSLCTNSNGQKPALEYWVQDANGVGSWSPKPAPQDQIRLNIIVHEASPLWMGVDPQTSVVGTDYRPHGVNNVYLTGASIFPTSGSWNPTLTMCGLAQDLADRLVPVAPSKAKKETCVEVTT